MVTLIIITAFVVRKLVGRVYLMVTLIIIIAFSLCNLVGKKINASLLEILPCPLSIVIFG